MITSYHGGNTSLSNFSIPNPISDTEMLGLGGGGELVKEVVFAFMLCFCIYALLLFCASPFCDVQWLAGSPFYKVVILYSLLFQNLDPFLQSNFLWFCLTFGLKN